MKLKKANDEIDLSEVIQTILNKKWYVFLIVIFSLVFTYFVNPKKNNNEIIVSYEIRPLTVYDEAKYEIYNSFIRSLKIHHNLKLYDNFYKQSNSDKSVFFNDTKKILENELLAGTVNKEFLFDLFKEVIEQQSYIINSLKKFNFLKKQDYLNDSEYELAILNLAGTIKFKNSFEQNNKQTKYFVQFQTQDVEKWKNFLVFIENDVNQKIKINLLEIFENYLNNSKKIKNFEIEDIDTRLKIISDEKEIIELKQKKSILATNKYYDRMLEAFLDSPFNKTSEFYAAKIIFDSKIENFVYADNNNKKFLLVGIISTILGIFVVLIMNAIFKRK